MKILVQGISEEIIRKAATSMYFSHSATFIAGEKKFEYTYVMNYRYARGCLI